MSGDPMTRDELLALPATIDLATAARALGVGRGKAYEMVKRDEFPVPVIRFGSRIRVITEYLLRLLEIERFPAEKPDAPPCPHEWHARQNGDMVWNSCFLCGAQTDYARIKPPD